MLSPYQELNLRNFSTLAQEWVSLGKIQEQVLIHSETF